jgi:hypothetical protein
MTRRDKLYDTLSDLVEEHGLRTVVEVLAETCYRSEAWRHAKGVPTEVSRAWRDACAVLEGVAEQLDGELK